MSVVRLFLGGDVMLGRGVDQILPCPGDPVLRERYVRDARTYVRLAEAANGPIPWPVDVSWPWGDALGVLDAAAPDVRVVNLETSLTRGGTFMLGKGVHYRMNPANIGCLTAVRPDVCVLANNHVLDFGQHGLAETLDVLARAGLRTAGAGPCAAEAGRPAVVDLGNSRRVLIIAFGVASSGVPVTWAAMPGQPGVSFLPELSAAHAAEITGRVRRVKRAGDVAVASIHWGSNWGFEVPADQVTFAHALIDGGVDVVFGHSSHHARPIEVYQGKLILYGCGDLVNDYEGIASHPQYRPDLRLLYFASVDPGTGALTGLRMTPMQARQIRLCRATTEDSHWLSGVLGRISRGFGAEFTVEPDGALALRHLAGASRCSPGAS